jgi:hypothetical protein
MTGLAAKQSIFGPKNNIGTPGIGAGTVGSGTAHAPDTTALEQKGGIINISNDKKMSELDTNGPSLAGNNLYSETNQYAP